MRQGTPAPPRLPMTAGGPCVIRHLNRDRYGITTSLNSDDISWDIRHKPLSSVPTCLVSSLRTAMVYIFLLL